MKRNLIVATLLLCTMPTLAQEMVMKVQKTDGTTAKTRVADLKQITFLGTDIDEENLPSSTMIMKLANGAALRTAMDEVADISFADTYIYKGIYILI